MSVCSQGHTFPLINVDVRWRTFPWKGALPTGNGAPYQKIDH